MAPGANIDFVYTGSNTNFRRLRLGGLCGRRNDRADHQHQLRQLRDGTDRDDLTTLETIMQQAATQGQTIVAASGDQGSTACSGTRHLTT